MPEQEQLNKYDLQYASIMDVSLSTKPSTVKLVQSLTGKSETFIVQTARHEENGDYVYLEHIDESGVQRIAIPPKVANLIASQREALTKRRRSISSRNTMRARMEAGEVIGFRKKA